MHLCWEHIYNHLSPFTMTCDITMKQLDGDTALNKTTNCNNWSIEQPLTLIKESVTIEITWSRVPLSDVVQNNTVTNDVAR